MYVVIPKEADKLKKKMDRGDNMDLEIQTNKKSTSQPKGRRNMEEKERRERPTENTEQPCRLPSRRWRC